MHSKKLKQFTVFYDNPKEFRGIYREIFENSCYYVELSNSEPVIVDAGAHIGLSTLYFKHLYPKSQIIAVEPHPKNLSLLEFNLEVNSISDVTVVPAALVPRDYGAVVEFYSDSSRDQWFSTSSLLPHAWDESQQNSSMEVETCTLDDLIYQPIDLLKLDIEGVEFELLEDYKDGLSKVKHIVMEYHPIGKSNLKNLIQLLERERFSTKLWKQSSPIHLPYTGNDLLLIEAHKAE